MGVREKFYRSQEAPKSAEVAGWPFPQWSQVDSQWKPYEKTYYDYERTISDKDHERFMNSRQYNPYAIDGQRYDGSSSI